MLKILKNRKGSAEIIAFILVLPFLLLPIFNTVDTLRTLLVYDALRQAGRATIIKMEMDGGLRSEELAVLKAVLGQRGFQEGNIHVDYTPYPVEYGREVRLAVHYLHPSVTYTIGLRGLEKSESTFEMVFGPVSSVSKKYFRE